MNIIDIIFILVLGYSLLAGMHKGFIASGLSLLGFAAAWFGAYFSYGTLMNAVLANSTIMGFCSNLLEASSFFNGVDANKLVSDMAGSDAFSEIAAYIGEKIPLIADAFAGNVNTQAFAGKLFGNTQLLTLADYLDQTVWVAVFGVLSFIVMFALIYVVVTLFVNLLNHVITFPILRRIDWLVGGIFGLFRGAGVCMLMYVVVNYLMTMFIAEDSAIFALISDSSLLAFVDGLSFLNVEKVLTTIIGG